MIGTGRCVKCGSDYNSKKQMRLKVGPCGHELCTDCFAILFCKGNKHPCPYCGDLGTKNAWEDKRFAGIVHIDRRARMHDLRDLVLTRDDYEQGPEGQRRYDDYLEMVEDYAEALTTGEGKEATLRKIQTFVKEHESKIASRKKKIIAEAGILSAANKSRSQTAAVDAVQSEEQKQMREQREKQRHSNALLAQVADPNCDAAVAFARHRMSEEERHEAKRRAAGVTHHNTGDVVFFGDESTSVAAAVAAAPLFTYKPTQIDAYGPMVPATPALGARTGTFLVSASCPSLPSASSPYPVMAATGFPAQLAIKRALAEAYNCLYDM